MPTNRKRRSRGIVKQSIDTTQIHFFSMGQVWIFSDRKKPTGKSLGKGEGRCVVRVDKEKPCSRPWAWWKFEAPKEPVNGWDHVRFNSPQRLRLGGIGTPTHEVLGSWSGFDKGLPTSWVDQWQADYYNGRSVDIHGKPIGTEYNEGHFKGVAIVLDDPPIFESVAAYLDRHGFLTDAKTKHLEKHPELLEPEKIEFDQDDEDY